jgi:hypothetical protein
VKEGGERSGEGGRSKSEEWSEGGIMVYRGE